MKLEFTKLEFHFFFLFFHVKSKSSLGNSILGLNSSFTNSISKKQSNLLNTFNRILSTEFFLKNTLFTKICLILSLKVCSWPNDALTYCLYFLFFLEVLFLLHSLIIFFFPINLWHTHAEFTNSRARHNENINSPLLFIT